MFKTLQDSLTLNLLTTTIVAPPSNVSKWQMGFNSAFKGLKPVETRTLKKKKPKFVPTLASGRKTRINRS